jgi:hypothetical protein
MEDTHDETEADLSAIAAFEKKLHAHTESIGLMVRRVNYAVTYDDVHEELFIRIEDEEVTLDQLKSYAQFGNPQVSADASYDYALIIELKNVKLPAS